MLAKQLIYLKQAGEGGEASGVTLTAKVYLMLRDEIAQGRLEPGTKLVRRKLSQNMGVSTIPIMDALRQLERDGLVEHRCYSGTCVRCFSEQSLRDDIQLREALETQVARLCAQQKDRIDLNSLYYLAGQVDGVMLGHDSLDHEGMQLHMRFHMALSQAANCPPLHEQLEKLWYREMMLACWASSCLKPVPKNWHHDLVSVIASGNVQKADDQARMHVCYGRETFIDHLLKLGKIVRNRPGG